MTNGRVLATDISPTILTCAAEAAAATGYTNLETRAVDGEELDVDEGAFDAVFSRLGLIYFGDQQRALAGMRRALRPCGCPAPQTPSASSETPSAPSTRCSPVPPKPSARTPGAEIERELARFPTPTGFKGPCELLAASGIK